MINPRVPDPTPALLLLVLTVWAGVTTWPRIRDSEGWRWFCAGLQVACRLPGWVLLEWWERRRGR